jgi:hypothetical protein
MVQAISSAPEIEQETIRKMAGDQKLMEHLPFDKQRYQAALGKIILHGVFLKDRKILG